MPNEEHVKIARQGANAINDWFSKNPYETFKLTGADLTNIDLSGIDFSGTILTPKSIKGTPFQALHDKLFVEKITGYSDGIANISGDWEVPIFERVDLRKSNLSGANLTKTNLSRVNLSKADLTKATLTEAVMKETILDGVELYRAKGISRIKHLDTARITPGGSNVIHLAMCHIDFYNKHFNWEKIKTVGKLPLFSASYTILILYPVFFYGLALYNKHVESARAWASEFSGYPSHQMYGTAQLILEVFHRIPPPTLSLILALSTLLLAIASSIYVFVCPTRIKEFSCDYWDLQLGQRLIYYLSLSWRSPRWRFACAACYLVGGGGAISVIVWKFIKAIVFIVEYV